MKRIAFLTMICLAVVASASAVAPVVKVINGNPLSIHVGSDLSFQIFNTSVPGQGQIYPSSCQSTADMGMFLRSSNGALIAPNFNEHSSCATATGNLGTTSDWSPVSISDVLGDGTEESPFSVIVVAEAPGTGIRDTMEVRYINGKNYYTISNSFRANAQTRFDAFIGGDIYLASSDFGIPYYDTISRSPGGRDCESGGYTILFIPLDIPTGYTARHYAEVWSEIGTGSLTNTVNEGCQDNGAALEWADRSVAAGETDRIDVAISFGEVPDIARFRIDEVVPPNAIPGENLTVKVLGVGFQGTTTFDFGAGITASNIVIQNPNEALVTLSVAADAELGLRQVSGEQTPGGVASTLPGGFEVTRSGFTILSFTPPAIRPGQTVSAEVVGSSLRSETDFDFGQGIVIVGKAIISEERAILALMAELTATPGFRDLVATQTPGGRQVTLPQALQVGAEPVADVDVTGNIAAELRCRGSICRAVKGSVVLKNTGSVLAKKVRVRVYVSTTPFFHPETAVQIKKKRITLPPGLERSFSFRDRKYGQSLVGNYAVAVIDPDNQIAESNEQNNILIFGPIE